MKRKLLTLIPLVLVLTALLIISGTSCAHAREYEVSGYKINVLVQPDGSANIEERLTYSFSGEFNGILRDIDFSSTGGISDPEVYVDRDGDLQKLKLYSSSDIDAEGGEGTYNMVKDDRILHFKIFEHSYDEEKTFVIKYTFSDAVTKYADIAEFNRKIIDSGWDISLNNVEINMTLPEGASENDIKVFGHGALTGDSEIIDENHVRFTVPLVVPGDNVETLVLFPTILVPDAAKVVDKEALPGILENEKKLADEANAQRQEAKRKAEQYFEAKRAGEQRQAAKKARIDALKPYAIVLTILLSVFWLLTIIYLYKKYDKEFKPSFQGKYYRELPGEYTPAEMSSLLNMRHVSTRDITATLMDLVRKKQIILTPEKHVKSGLFKNKEVTSYRISANPNAPDVSLKKHESFLMKWFLKTIGNGDSILLEDISDYGKTESGARHFKEDYDKWCKLALEESDKNDFFDNTCKKGSGIGILISLGYLIAGLILTLIFKEFLIGVLLAEFLILFIFSMRIGRRTEYGSEQYAMWQAFKNFLKDFSNLDKAEMPSIVIWEHYLVYAVSLGVAKDVIRQLPLVFADTDLQDEHLTYMYVYHSYSDFNTFSRAIDTTISSMDSAISNAIAVANSTLSDAGGGGGGFSGGSSGGGGGGGGGGAF